MFSKSSPSITRMDWAGLKWNYWREENRDEPADGKFFLTRWTLAGNVHSQLQGHVNLQQPPWQIMSWFLPTASNLNCLFVLEENQNSDLLCGWLIKHTYKHKIIRDKIPKKSHLDTMIATFILTNGAEDVIPALIDCMATRG